MAFAERMRRSQTGLATLRRVAAVVLAGLAGLGLYGCGQADVDRSVMLVTVLSPKQNSVGYGTGFVVARDTVITNEHVVAHAVADKDASILLFTEGKKPSRFQGKVAWSNSDLDLAILQVDGLTAPALVINDGEVDKSDPVTAIGFPESADAADTQGDAFTISTLTSGAVSRLFRADWKGRGVRVDIIQHTAPINAGNSGGPLLNACQEVIGVNTSKGITSVDSNLLVQQREGTFFSSHALELARILKTRGVPATIRSSRCSPDSNFAVLAASFGFLGALAFVAMFFALRRSRGGSMTDQINRVRHAIGLDDDSRTQLAPGAAADPNAPGLIARSGALAGREFRIDVMQARAGGVIVGRNPGRGGLLVGEPLLSRQNSRVLLDANGGYWIEDLRSRNGTEVNGVRLRPGERRPLRNADRLRLGTVDFEFTAGAAGAGAAASRIAPVGGYAAWSLAGTDPATGKPLSYVFDSRQMEACGGRLIIGRDAKTCDLLIAHPTITGSGHAKLALAGDRLYITDLNSTNGTKVDGMRIGQGGKPSTVEIRPGGSVQLGTVVLTLTRTT